MVINKHFYILVLLLSMILVYVNFLSAVESVPLKQGFEKFPEKIGNFTKTNSQAFSPAVVENAGMDDYLMWHYRDEQGYTLGLYIGYYQNQTQGAIIHSPRHCMPGGGWNTLELKTVSITDPQPGKEHHQVNQMLLHKGLDKQLALYWYHSRGRIVANEYLDRILMILDSILRKRSDGALIRITGPGSNLEKDLAKQVQFANALLGVLNKHLPQ